MSYQKLKVYSKEKKKYYTFYGYCKNIHENGKNKIVRVECNTKIKIGKLVSFENCQLCIEELIFQGLHLNVLIH